MPFRSIYRSPALSLGTLVVLSLGYGACGKESTELGLIPAEHRQAPLTPAARAELEAKGAVCTPNPGGPVLCRWSQEGASCSLTFDVDDELTHLLCSVDDFTYECTRPAAGYVCRWSDAPECAHEYDAKGSFVRYTCDLSSVDGGPNPDLDGGVPDDVTWESDGGEADAEPNDVGPWDFDSGPWDFDSGPWDLDGGEWDGGPWDLDGGEWDGGPWDFDASTQDGEPWDPDAGAPADVTQPWLGDGGASWDAGFPIDAGR